MAHNRLSTSSPDNCPGFAAGSVLDFIHQISAVEVESASGAIGIKEGFAPITKAGVAATTLAAPTAGLPSAGGDDGKVLRIKSTTANAHTVTTPANKLNGNKAVATFSGAVTDFIELIAYNGVWQVMASSGITLS